MRGTHTLASITTKVPYVDIEIYALRKGLIQILLPLICVVQRLEARFAAQ